MARPCPLRVPRSYCRRTACRSQDPMDWNVTGEPRLTWTQSCPLTCHFLFFFVFIFVLLFLFFTSNRSPWHRLTRKPGGKGSFIPFPFPRCIPNQVS